MFASRFAMGRPGMMGGRMGGGPVMVVRVVDLRVVDVVDGGWMGSAGTGLSVYEKQGY